jgi:hypothetical protein
VHEGYAEMGVAELLVFDPLLFGPKSLGGPVALQLWQRDLTGAFERTHFGKEPVFSRSLEAWLSVDGRKLCISEDRAGTRQWPTLEEAAAARALAEGQAMAKRAENEAAQAKDEAAQAKDEAVQAKNEAARERAERAQLEARLRELEATRKPG